MTTVVNADVAVVGCGPVGDTLAILLAQLGHDAVWALQRPDFHLYGTTRTPTGAAALLVDLRRHLSIDHPEQGALT